jgi:hypothetical protein
MRDGAWAEWLIARFNSRTRAASIVGDLLETATLRGTLWFWQSVAGVVFSLIWRRTLAFLAAFYLGLHALGWLQIDGAHAMPAAFGTLLWIAAPYAAIRYGFRDKFVQLALGLCSLSTIYALYWRIPIAADVCVALALTILIASVRSAQRTKALIALAAALLFGSAGALVSMFLEGIWQNHFYAGAGQIDSPLLCCFALLTVWSTTTACGRMHHLVLRADQQSTEIQ